MNCFSQLPQSEVVEVPYSSGSQTEAQLQRLWAAHRALWGVLGILFLSATILALVRFQAIQNGSTWEEIAIEEWSHDASMFGNHYHILLPPSLCMTEDGSSILLEALEFMASFVNVALLLIYNVN